MNIPEVFGDDEMARTGEIFISPAFQGREPASVLAKVTDSAGFSSVARQLKTALSHLDQPDGDVVEVLRENIQRLQDAFIDAVYSLMEDHSIDLDHKLTLFLDPDGALRSVGEHPDKEKLDRILAGYPDLARTFDELATQSSALRDLSSLQSMIVDRTTEEVPARLTHGVAEPAYQLSIKGDMNHFYFCPMAG